MADTIGFGIIGCGNIAPTHAEAIAGVANAHLVAVADINEANAQKFVKKHGGDVYTDFNEMLKRDDIQAVSLCVPSGLRLKIAKACAAAGKHIVAEKPLEVTTERIDELVAAIDKHNVKISCIFQNRFADGPQHIREALDKGRFGKMVLGDAYIKWYRSAEYYASGDWRGTRSIDGGGVLMNQGIHQIDLLLWFMGSVRTVTAKTALVGHEGLEVEDLAVAMLEFENGALGTIEGTTAAWPGHSARLEVLGTKGSAILEDGALISWQFDEEQPEDSAIKAALDKESELGTGAGDPLAGLKSEGHRRQIEDFVQSILENRPPRIDGREGRRAVELIEAIYASAESGKPVNL